MNSKTLLLIGAIALNTLASFRAGAQVPTGGLTLWLKGDTGVTLNGATVSAWADQSGQGHDVTQTDVASQPTLMTSGSGHSAVRFDGANDFLPFTLPINGLDGITIFLVANNTSATQTGGTSFSDSPAIFWNETASWGWVFLGPFQTNVNWRCGTTTAGNNHRYPRPASIGQAYSLTTLVKNADIETLYVDRSLALQVDFKGYPLAGVADTGYLGRGFNTYYAGELLEVLVYTQALSDTDRQTVEDYLHNKYLANQRPTVAITSPADLATFNAPASITVAADAIDDSSVTNVEFFANGSPIGSDGTFPYSINWNNVPGGAYGLTAKATDNAGAWTISDRVIVRVEYATPQEGPVLNGLGLWYKGDVGVTSSGGNVSQWADQSGFERNASQPLAIGQPTLVTAGNGKPAVSFNGVSNYMTFSMPMSDLSALTIVAVVNNTAPQNTGDAGEGSAVLYWTEPPSPGWGGLSLGIFQDSATWRIGTGTSQSGSPNYPGPAYTRPTSIQREYSRTVVIKDGATEMLYVNGVLARTVTGKQTTTAAINETGANMGRGFLSGIYTHFRGEIQEILVYTSALSSAELASMETYLTAKYWTDAQPTVAVTSPANNTTFTAPANITITADPSDSDGTIAKVEFFDSGKLIGTVTSAPWEFTLANAAPGAHTLMVKATDDDGLFNYSAPVLVFGNPAAGFARIDNFEGRELGAILFQGDWSGMFPREHVVLDPTTFAEGNPTNKVLRVQSANQSLSIPVLIPEGATGTLFFRAASTTWSREILYLGLSDQPCFGRAVVGDFEAQVVRNTGNNLANPRLGAYDAGVTYTNLTAFASDVWYRIWVVADNSADTWKLYIQGGPLTTPTLVAHDSVSAFGFRNGAAANDLIRFLVWTSSMTVQNPPNGAFWLDDIYLAAGENLTDPTIPPAPAPPTLSITKSGNQVVIAWPASATGVILQSSASVSPTSWSDVTEPQVVVGDQVTVTVPIGTEPRFYSLRQ